MRLSAYETYCMYLALKNHFTRKSYDYIKYNGKVTATKDSFMVRKDRFQFQKLSRLYSEDEMKDFLISNFIKGRMWSVDMLQEEAEETYRKYMKRKQSMSYSFANDLDRLFSEYEPSTIFDTRSGIPPILNSAISEIISLETFTILDKYTGFVNSLNTKLEDDFLWQKYNNIPQKLHPFLVYDGDKLKNILKEKLHEHGFSSKEQKKSRTSQTEKACVVILENISKMLPCRKKGGRLVSILMKITIDKR